MFPPKFPQLLPLLDVRGAGDSVRSGGLSFGAACSILRTCKVRTGYRIRPRGGGAGTASDRLDMTDCTTRSPLLKPEEVAAILNCHESTVCRMVESGRLKGIYLMGPPAAQRRGKKGLRILPESVDDLLTTGPQEVAQFQQAVRPTPEPSPPATAVLPPPQISLTRKRTGGRRAWEVLPPR